MNSPDRQAEAPGVHPLAPEITADLSRASLFVASPMYGGLCHDAFLLGMIDLRQACDAHRIPLHVLTIRNESLVQRGRNTCVAHFLASDATHLLFIDADIGFSAGAALRLLAHRRDVIGGAYAKKSLGEPDFAFLPISPAVVQEGGLVEVHSLATGFLLLSRDAVQRMVGAYGPATRYRVHPSEGGGAWADNLFALFDCERDDASLSYWSEDYTFCQRWRRIGGQCWLDPHILLEHHGTARFAGHPWRLYSNKPEAAPCESC